MNEHVKSYVKLALFWFVALSIIPYLFLFGPKPSSAKDIRKEQLEDRAFFVEQKTVALTKLRTCYNEAQKDYDGYWARMCKSTNSKQIDECIAQSVPDIACRAKFVFSPNCELPKYNALAAETFMTEHKAECNTMYKYETAPVFGVESSNGK